MIRLAVFILLTGCAGWSAGLKPVSSAEVCGRCHRAILEATANILFFVKAAKTLGDTRLAPDESRREEFSYNVKAGVQTNVKATLSYVYSPLARTQWQQRVIIPVA